ncbi:MAG: hypothetical protein KDC07_01155 [Chitinophagaceae bacterium]|nr:hypothetical protein [Chitinophagaceae bacterium]MCB9044669.1 hypothetical protein [Chitinophagales bacterium]
MEQNTNNIELLNKITEFINSIGISCKPSSVKRDSFLPGVDIINGGIVYDADQLLSPGDLLHEAGHIAVLKEQDRKDVTSPEVSGDLDPGGAELSAIAWSWAALKHLDIDPEVVFHDQGYKGDADNIIDNFRREHYFGVSMLQWFGMTNERQHDGTGGDILYPAMQYWLRQN